MFLISKHNSGHDKEWPSLPSLDTQAIMKAEVAARKTLGFLGNPALGHPYSLEYVLSVSEKYSTRRSSRKQLSSLLITGYTGLVTSMPIWYARENDNKLFKNNFIFE
jgi:hypothetical protein